MIVAADTSPINYLVQIEAVEVLPQLYGRVLVPMGVWNELSHSRTPARVKEWLATTHRWLEVRSTSRALDAPSLGRGEAQAIQLALDDHADLLLIDDRAGREHARRLGLTTTGTLGVLVAAQRVGLLEAEAALSALFQSTNFNCSPDVARAALEQIRRFSAGEP